MADVSNVNERVIRGQAAQIRRSLNRLRELAQLSEGDFTAKADNFAIAEHHLRRSLEAMLDMGRHLIARCGLGAAQEYADVPRLLGEAGALASETVDESASLARLRNRLVHFYWQVGAEEMHRVLGERLSTIESFCREVLDWLAEEASETDD